MRASPVGAHDRAKPVGQPDQDLVEDAYGQHEVAVKRLGEEDIVLFGVSRWRALGHLRCAWVDATV
jgi:hypothetical protein